jgi:putative membrane protein
LFLLLYAAIVSFFISVASMGALGILSFLPALAVLLLSASAISSAFLLWDRKTIATFRRVLAVLLAGEILWLLCVAIGVVYTWASFSKYAVANTILFGAFVCAGLEFLAINGVFTTNAPFAFGLTAVHPASTFAIIGLSGFSSRFDPLALLFGAIAFFIILVFTFLLKRSKTSRGYDALTLFQSFMKTWTSAYSAELERIISAHSEEAEIRTKVLRFQTDKGDTFVVLPGVHPGPFHAVGSYDLPGVLSRAFNDLGPVMTLHRPGGHERNLATTADTAKYANQVSEFAKTITPSTADARLRGPLHEKIGKATVSSTAFSNDLVLTISFAPFGSDDLSATIENELAEPSSATGVDTYVVDAHNSINHEQETLDMKQSSWREILAHTQLEESKPFRVAYSHSREFKFPSGEDLTENGLGLLMVEADVKSVLVLADANNAVPPLREKVAKALESSGYNLIEFCTSDSHNLAARGLTVARGYKALGEQTQVDAIVKLTIDLARLADSRLSPSAYGSGLVTTKARVFGSRTIEEFATITQSSSKLGRYYFRFATAAVGILLLLSVIL